MILLCLCACVQALPLARWKNLSLKQSGNWFPSPTLFSYICANRAKVMVLLGSLFLHKSFLPRFCKAIEPSSPGALGWWADCKINGISKEVQISKATTLHPNHMNLGFDATNRIQGMHHITSTSAGRVTLCFPVLCWHLCYGMRKSCQTFWSSYSVAGAGHTWTKTNEWQGPLNVYPFANLLQINVDNKW